MKAIGRNLLVTGGSSLPSISSDFGETWQSISNNNLPYYGTSDLQVVGPWMFVICDSIIYRRPLADLFATSGVSNTSTSGSLSAFPNPCTVSTTLAVSDIAGPTQIEIVNAVGETVAHVFAGDLDPNAHTFHWQPEGLAPGVYFALVKSSQGVQRIPISYVK